MDRLRAHPTAVWLEVAAAAVLAVPLLAVLSMRHLGLDFWYDEVWGLRNYALQAPSVVLTDYATPNNHPLYNLITNLWLRLLGIRDLDDALGSPGLVRLPNLLFATGTAAYVYACARRCSGALVALAALLVLLTTVPFWNYALQARGYGLSMLLYAMLLFHMLRFLDARRRADGIVIVLATAGALYTLPSNLYAVLALTMTCAARAVCARRRDGASRAGASASAHAVLALVAGTVLAIVLYAPMLRQVVDHPFVRSDGPFRFATLTHTLPTALTHFVSARWLLVAAAAAELVVGLRRRRVSPDLVVLAIALLAPFLLSFTRGDRPFSRSFVVLVPAFVLLLTLSVVPLFVAAATARRRGVIVTAALWIYCAPTFAWELRGVDQRLRTDIVAGHTSQDLYHCYYLRHYRPSAVVASLRSELGTSPLVLGEMDRVALPAYLDRAGIRAEPWNALPQLLAEHGRVVLVTAWPDRKIRELRERVPASSVSRLPDPPSFHGVLVLSNASGARPVR